MELVQWLNISLFIFVLRLQMVTHLTSTSKFTNFSQNGISIEDDQYWLEIDTTFDRYIGYDQEGLIP